VKIRQILLSDIYVGFSAYMTGKNNFSLITSVLTTTYGSRARISSKIPIKRLVPKPNSVIIHMSRDGTATLPSE